MSTQRKGMPQNAEDGAPAGGKAPDSVIASQCAHWRGNPSSASPAVSLNVLYCDCAILICEKPSGVLSERGSGANLPDLAARWLSARGEAPAILTVHRLDKPVSGLMVLARTHEAAGSLIAQIAAHRTEKEYLAVVRGIPAEQEALWEDLLFHDSRVNKTYVVKRPRKGVRPAKLRYRTLQTVQTPEGPLTLVRVTLLTGRTHQIRAQFSSRGLPLYGDVRYGSPARETLALFSCRLSFDHPETGERMTFSLRPEGAPWSLFEA